MNNFIQGVYFFFFGLKLIFKPGLKRYLIVPIIMNFILLTVVLSGLSIYLSNYVSGYTTSLPKWIALILGGLFWIIYSFLSLLVGTFIFTMLTNIIAAPFYGFLAEACAERIKESKKTYPSKDTFQQDNIQINTHNESTLKTWIYILPRTLKREGRKLLYFLPWLLLCLLFVIIPFAWPLLPFVWWGVLSWILAIQYIDYQPDNERISFKDALNSLKENSMLIFGFGNAICVAMLIPGANLIVPPAAVAGGTALWLKIKREL